MRSEGHPKVHLANFRCACGASFQAYSTKPEIQLDICNSCHPFYTGKQKYVDIAGRVDRFNKRYAAVSAKK